MKNLYEIDRRMFLEYFGFSVATLALIGSGVEIEAQSHVMHEDAPNTHNMLVFGDKKIYLSHLPMFDGANEDKTEFELTLPLLAIVPAFVKPPELVSVAPALTVSVAPALFANAPPLTMLPARVVVPLLMIVPKFVT